MAGWVEERSTGRWRLNVPGGTGPDGKRVVHRKMVEAKTERAAKKLLDLFSAEVQKGEYIEPSKLTFTEFVERWYKNYADSNLAPKTLFRYKQILSSRVLPAMGHLQVEQIKPFHLMEFYANLQEDGVREDGKPGGLSPKTILQHHRIISSILNDAVEWQVIPFNPASRVKPPKVQKKQAACYEEEHVVALLAAAESEETKYQVLIQLAIFTGARRGELMGLEWQDINLDAGTMEIRQASQYVPGKGVFAKDPKNESSSRLLSLPAFLVNKLRHYSAEQAAVQLKKGDMWQGSDRVFTTFDGRAMHPDTISGWFPKFLARHELPPLPFHGLRHTAATMLINQNLPTKSVSGRMGHANISTTYDIYGHFLKSADKEASDRLEQVYQRMKDKGKKDTKIGLA